MIELAVGSLPIPHFLRGGKKGVDNAKPLASGGTPPGVYPTMDCRVKGPFKQAMFSLIFKIPSLFEKLISNGLTTSQISKESKRHLASSIEDLKILLQKEITLLQSFEQEKSSSAKHIEYLKTIGNLTCIQR